MSNILYATLFACDSMDQIGASARTFCHAVVYQFGHVGVIFLVLLMRGQYLQSGVLQKLKPLSYEADQCLLLLDRLVSADIDGSGSGLHLC